MVRGRRFATKAALSGILAATAWILHGMGRIWWCQCGGLVPWSWGVWSEHNSQHLFDPYTFSHIQHGLIFYWLFFFLLRRIRPTGRFALALGLEATWEILENTPFMIDRYREVTISLDYFGDSIINSLADIVTCAAGYGLAAMIPFWSTALVFAVIEGGMVLWIRDSFLLNIWMLISPSDAIRNWQIGK